LFARLSNGRLRSSGDEPELAEDLRIEEREL
jgi:hypothetical protein